MNNWRCFFNCYTYLFQHVSFWLSFRVSISLFSKVHRPFHIHGCITTINYVGKVGCSKNDHFYVGKLDCVCVWQTRFNWHMCYSSLSSIFPFTHNRTFYSSSTSHTQYILVGINCIQKIFVRVKWKSCKLIMVVVYYYIVVLVIFTMRIYCCKQSILTSCTLTGYVNRLNGSSIK